MADVLKRMVGPYTLPVASGTLYTVPTSTTSVLRNIHICNEGTVAASFTLSIGTDGTPSHRLFYLFIVAPNDVFDWTGNIVLVAGEQFTGQASIASSLTLTVSGIESS